MNQAGSQGSGERFTETQHLLRTNCCLQLRHQSQQLVTGTIFVHVVGQLNSLQSKIRLRKGRAWTHSELNELSFSKFRL